jgi:nucleoside-diphosphate-sugar epimerase
MTEEFVLITGANGEIGQSLIEYICTHTNKNVIALDISPACETMSKYCHQFIQGNILDENLLGELFSQYHFSTIFHLASLLSTRAEQVPALAQRVNVQGTFNLLDLAVNQFEHTQSPSLFLYPSSIAVYGLPNLNAKNNALPVKEIDYLNPITLYGIHKLACENLGKYFSQNYQLLEKSYAPGKIDFRALRFPGLISAKTIPTGGTSDYGPEMLHHAAQNLPYACFVRPDATLPFMVMPDAVRAILMLSEARKTDLTQSVYNVTSFNPSAEHLKEITRHAFPDAEITHVIHPARQRIVDSWPKDVDDHKARADWGWRPKYNLEAAFNEYLIPSIRERYTEKIS